MLKYHDFHFFTIVTIVTKVAKQIDGLVQDCSNSNALEMGLLQFCTKPSKLYSLKYATVWLVLELPMYALQYDSYLCETITLLEIHHTRMASVLLESVEICNYTYSTYLYTDWNGHIYIQVASCSFLNMYSKPE